MMKLVRFCATGAEKPDLVDDNGELRDFSSYVADIAGETLSSAGLAALAAREPSSLPCVGGDPRFGACVAGTDKLICIGLNYGDHARAE